MTCMTRITIAVAARGANMATRFTNESTGRDSVTTCQAQVFGPDHASREVASNQGDTAYAVVDRRRKSRVSKRLRLLASLGFLIAPTTGCTILSGMGKQLSQHEQIDEFMVNYRNEAWAAKAWHCRKHKFCNKKYLGDVEAGFRAGYESVAAGGNGCVPSVCPQAYWGWQYQTADGQCRMNAWFEGFPLGVQAAEQDGIGHWSQVRTSMAVPPPVHPGTLPVAGVALGEGPVVGGLTDQVETVPVPMADPNQVIDTAVPMTVEPPAQKAEAAKPKLSAPKATEPGLDMPLTPAPKAVVPAAPPVPANPAPAAVPPVPQPKSDPFGFD